MQRIWGVGKARGISSRGLKFQSAPPNIFKLNTIRTTFATRPFSNPAYTTPFLINNQEVVSSKVFDVYSPTDSKKLWSASAATLSDVKNVTQAAAAAFPSWSTTKLVKRRELLMKFADVLKERADDLKECLRLETAAQVPWAELNIDLAAGFVTEVAGRLTSITGTIPESIEEGRTAFVHKEPYGVVLSIAPWNAPVILATRSIIYPLAAGNTIILKSSELSPRTHFLLASLFVEAGFPPGVVNVIGHASSDSSEIMEALISQREVKKINFTGSTAVGRKIAAKAGKHLKPILLELGGKASFIVLEDADIEKAAEAAVLGSFIHAGQICMATEKIIVHSSIVEPFTKALEAAAKKFPGGQPMVLPGSRKKLQDLVDSAVQQGATILGGDSREDDKSPNTFPNTIIRDVTDKMDFYHVELFGPLASITAVDSEEEAIRIANDTEYGLSSAVWTRDLGRALKIARKIECGAVHINGMTIHDEPNLPHGGRKGSGYGRFGGSWGLDEFLTTKTVTFIS